MTARILAAKLARMDDLGPKNLPTIHKSSGSKIEVDLGIVDELCELHCTLDEISNVIGISVTIMNKRIKEMTGYTAMNYVIARSAKGAVSLRRAQYMSALGGSVPMQIWLGKQVLGQTDKKVEQVESSEKIVSLEEARDIMMQDVAKPDSNLESDTLNV